MEVYKKYDLYRHNTMRLHCIADYVYFPNTIEELREVVVDFKKKRQQFKLLGAGSNIVLPKRLHKSVIVLTKFSDDIEFEKGHVRCGASVRIQKFIRECQKKGFGGIEYLFSVPCNMGGAIVQNAGRGREYNESIGNFVREVICLNLDSLEIEKLSNYDCQFNYRSSIFQEGNRIILNVELTLNEMLSSDIEKRIQNRIQYAKKNLDDSHPSCGSVFNLSSSFIMRHIRGMRIGGAVWSKKTVNWISNIREANNWQVRCLIWLAIILHKVTFRPYHLEVEIWK